MAITCILLLMHKAFNIDLVVIQLLFCVILKVVSRSKKGEKREMGFFFSTIFEIRLLGNHIHSFSGIGLLIVTS